MKNFQCYLGYVFTTTQTILLFIMICYMSGNSKLSIYLDRVQLYTVGLINENIDNPFNQILTTNVHSNKQVLSYDAHQERNNNHTIPICKSQEVPSTFNNQHTPD